MGTTMVMLIAEERRVSILNIGDSRGYRLRDCRLEQITLDHALVEEQVRLGRMSRAEALRSPLQECDYPRAGHAEPRLRPTLSNSKPSPAISFCSVPTVSRANSPTR